MQYLNVIESYFGISPDGGDGSLEVAVFAVLIVIGTLIGLYLANDRKSNTDVLN